MKTKLEKAPSNKNFVCRLVSEDGKIEMGVWPTLFGFRVRAGYVGAGTCLVDWCCGQSRLALTYAYNACKLLLEKNASFEEMLGSSDTRPYYHDVGFMTWLDYECPLSELGAYEHYQSLPSLFKIRKEYRKTLIEFGSKHGDFQG